jgi:F-type H+-transporting ATPase subunit gamma
MANLKEIRNRIVSVNSTRQITAAMKMVSAAKLKRAQDAVIQMRPYAEKLQGILSNLSSSLEAADGGDYSVVREVKTMLIVAITSNRGLCGGFNNNVIKRANILIKENPGVKIEVLTLGKKAFDAFKKTGMVTTKGFDAEPFKIFDNLTFDNVSIIAESVMTQFKAGDYDKVVLVYNSFKNAGVQLIQAEQFLPIVPPAATENTSTTDYIFEPGKKEIVDQLIPQSLKTQFFKALLDSRAAEHGARMTAMHKATDNATDLVKELKLTYNKARQAAITGEILEIVGGAEALKK